MAKIIVKTKKPGVRKTATVSVPKVSRPSNNRSLSRLRKNVSIDKALEDMTLDELLDASSAVTMYLRERKTKKIKSKNVKTYVDFVTELVNDPKMKKETESCIDMLNTKILEKNSETLTVKPAEAKKLYAKFMKTS